MQRLSTQDRNYDGTTTTTDAAAKKPESKETQLCRAIDKKLVAFWVGLVPAFTDYEDLAEYAVVPVPSTTSPRGR